MSRTIRIKNNYKASVCNPWRPRDIPKDCDDKYIWIPNDSDTSIHSPEYMVQVADDSKEGKWKYRKELHGQGRCGNSWRNRGKWVKKLVNTHTRLMIKRDLHTLVKGGYEDVILETEKHSMPNWTW